MASACVNTTQCAGVSPEPFLWPSPRLSFSRDCAAGDGGDDDQSPPPPLNDESSISPKDLSDFEFHLDDPVAMLPADELFSNGKLVPLHSSAAAPPPLPATEEATSPDEPPAAGSDPLAPSPRAPMCTSRWRDLLKLKKLQNHPKSAPIQSKKGNPNPNPNSRPLRFLLKRGLNTNKSGEPSMSLPLLPSGTDQEEAAPLPPKIRLSRPVPAEDIEPDHVRTNRISAPPPPARGPSTVDSPRLNAAGKVVFQGLERSSSSPGNVTGGPRVKYRGIERSYSANVRIAPVLNVPVCSLRGSRKSVSVFGFERLFKADKRDRSGGVAPPPPAAAGYAATRGGGSKGKGEKVEEASK